MIIITPVSLLDRMNVAQCRAFRWCKCWGSGATSWKNIAAAGHEGNSIKNLSQCRTGNKVFKCTPTPWDSCHADIIFIYVL